MLSEKMQTHWTYCTPFWHSWVRQLNKQKILKGMKALQP